MSVCLSVHSPVINSTFGWINHANCWWGGRPGGMNGDPKSCFTLCAIFENSMVIMKTRKQRNWKSILVAHIRREGQSVLLLGQHIADTTYQLSPKFDRIIFDRSQSFGPKKFVDISNGIWIKKIYSGCKNISAIYIIHCSDPRNFL